MKACVSGIEEVLWNQVYVFRLGHTRPNCYTCLLQINYLSTKMYDKDILHQEKKILNL